MYNIRVIKFLEPKKLILFGLFVWLFLFIFSPFSSLENISISYYFFIFINILFYLIGALLIGKRIKPHPINKAKTIKLFYIFFWIALFGVLFKLTDKFIIRGVSFDASPLENRDYLQQGAGNIIGIMGSLLSPLSFHVLFSFFKYKISTNKILKVVILIMPFIQVLDTLAIGSRSSILVTILFVVIFLSILNKLKLTFKKGVIYFSLFIGFLIFLQNIFIKRTSNFVDEYVLKEHVTELSGFNKMLNTNQEFNDYIINNNSYLGDLLFTYTLTTKYYLHGMFELNHLINNFNKNHTYGGFTFLLYKRILYKITGKNADISSYATIMPRNGIFTSFLGPIYVDFGWFSPIFLFIFGIYSKKIHNRLISNDDSAILLYVYLSVVILFFPVFNFISGANGLFIFTSFLLIKPITKIKL